MKVPRRSDDASTLTAHYERWLGRQIPLVEDDLRRKHVEMRSHEFSFLRGSYYLWLVRLAAHVPDASTAPTAPAVGDLHVENFGTWRDGGGVRRWGVNDLDELATAPAVADLVRLATSAVLAPHIAVPDADVCALLREAWASTRPRAALDLAEDGAGHVRRLVAPAQDAGSFYGRLAAGALADDVPASVRRAAAEHAEPGWTPRWHERAAGTGSLGHRRVVGVGPAADGRDHAREGKQLGPGTAAWVATLSPDVDVPMPDDRLYAEVVSALRGPATARRVDGWQLRDLAPDIARIDLAGLHRHDTERVLTSMAQATADVHGTVGARLRAAVDDLEARPHGWFADAVTTMVEVTRRDFAAFAGA